MQKRLSKHTSLRLLIIGVVLLLLLTNVGISINPGDNGGCISVTFDKLPMLLAQKAILCVDGEQYDVSDTKLVREIVRESVVATNTDLRYVNTERWIDIYCGNCLVRRIHWITGDYPMFIVYNASPIHWIFFSNDGDGIVFPSDKLINNLESVIGTS